MAAPAAAAAPNPAATAAVTPAAVGAGRVVAGHIKSLDGIRAISFLLVFLSHAVVGDIVPGGLGVTIFFFLSGYLITTLMRVEYEKNHAINFRHFWLRRALRILPPFYLVLFGAAAGSLIFDPPGTLTAATLTAQSLHITNYWIIRHGYTGQPEGTGLYWSLAVEEHFYLVFPWLYAGMQKARLSARGQASLLWGLCALVLLWRCILVFGLHAASNRTYMATDTRVDSILFGCALAVWGNPALDHLSLNERRWKYLIVPLALALLFGCLLYRAPAFRQTFRYSLQGIALIFIFIAAVRYSDWLPFRFLNWRPVAFIGVLSYTLYLIHYAILFAVQRDLPRSGAIPRGLLALGLSLLLAWLIYRVVEKPCARLRRRLTD